MYTQCSKCETIFKLSADTLRSAGGQVRCGRCGEVFNALSRLAEEPSAFTVGESPLDLEVRADQILGASAPAAAAPPPARDDYESLDPPGVQIAHLEIQDWSEGVAPQDQDPGLEFTLPPGELDRIFVEARPAAPIRIAELAPPAEASLAGSAAFPTIGLEVPESTRRELLESAATDDGAMEAKLLAAEQSLRSFAADAQASRRTVLIWSVAAIALGLLLMVQVLHRNRAALAESDRWGPLVRTLYARLGAPLSTPANLSAYQLRQWGVTGEPTANGALRVRASIMNTTGQLQPYPLLRVTLADRFGNRIGTRDFEAVEYLGKPAVRELSPGERADATVDILDPGKNAEGFEIDVCLRGADRRPACANDAATHPR